MERGLNNGMDKAIDTIITDVAFEGWAIETSWDAKKHDIRNVEHRLDKIKTCVRNLVVITDNFITKNNKSSEKKIKKIGWLNKQMTFANARPAEIGTDVFVDDAHKDCFLIFVHHIHAGKNHAVYLNRLKVMDSVDFDGVLV